MRSTDRSNRPTSVSPPRWSRGIADIDIPVAVIWGREDGWIPVDRAYRLAEMIPGCELSIVPEAGHLIQLDQPVALATTLHSWLARRSESAPSEGAT